VITLIRLIERWARRARARLDDIELEHPHHGRAGRDGAMATMPLHRSGLF